MPHLFMPKALATSLVAGFFALAAAPAGAMPSVADIGASTNLGAAPRVPANSCMPVAAQLSCGIGLSASCSACDTSAVDKLESFTVALSQAGQLRRFGEGQALQTLEFTVPPGGAPASNPSAPTI